MDKGLFWRILDLHLKNYFHGRLVRSIVFMMLLIPNQGWLALFVLLCLNMFVYLCLVIYVNLPSSTTTTTTTTSTTASPAMPSVGWPPPQELPVLPKPPWGPAFPALLWPRHCLAPCLLTPPFQSFCCTIKLFCLNQLVQRVKFIQGIQGFLLSSQSDCTMN